MAEQSYIYQDLDGTPLYRVVRPNGPKRFRFERYSDGEWKNGLRGVEKVLYNLPAVADAALHHKVQARITTRAACGSAPLVKKGKIQGPKAASRTPIAPM